MRSLVFAIALIGCGAPAPPTASPADPATNLAQMPAWSEARARGIDFRAVGQEPGWMLDIYARERILLAWDYGEELASFPLPQAVHPQEGLIQYTTSDRGRTLQIAIRRRPCQDAMSGEAFPAIVEVRIDGRVLTGCGRTL